MPDEIDYHPTLPLEDRAEKYRRKFEETYGKDNWHGFVMMIKAETKPHLVRSRFSSERSAKPGMTWPSYHLWEARAREIIAAAGLVQQP